ncbi:hypothetical protein ANCCEY_01734 [Ancylostoma ceylanicum]|uniref:Mos1 transposase HTH domain-containing protein n=2 Tax=Ancylostoma ceylanicum TaxID=53326 RepID=A0A0D6MCN2_9BILA|nr:hypothetical protein ANCCEY_01734 [Ancylostoma ceylanicum]EYC17868.1 hypothetical protein Y032_0029g1922 [Ancylostoma ceylanicum]
MYCDSPQGDSARAVTADICAAFYRNVVYHSTVVRWYQRFEEGDISMKGRPRSGQLSALRARPKVTIHQLEMTLLCSQRTIIELGLWKLLSTWISHELTDSDKASRISVCDSLFPPHSDFPKDIEAGNERWVLCVKQTHHHH